MLSDILHWVSYDSYGDIRFIWVALGVILAVMLIILLIMLATVPIEARMCSEFADLNPNLNVQFRFWGGCFVEYHGIFLPKSDFHAIVGLG